MADAKDKKTCYRIVLTKGQAYVADVRAESPEKACRLVTRVIAGKHGSDNDVSLSVLMDSWNDPSDDGYAWVVVPEKTEGKPLESMTWDGTSIIKPDAK